MNLLLIDHRTPYLHAGGGSASLLTLPLGTRSFLDHVAARTGVAAGRRLLVMPTFECNGDYQTHIQDCTTRVARVVAPSALPSVLGECEAGDSLLVIDPARWPIDGIDVAATIRGLGSYRGVTHAVTIGADGEQTRECVECDSNGQVKRVQRFYSGVTWPEVATSAILFSIAPARVVSELVFSSLPELRSALAMKGVLSRDVPVASDPVDLTEESGWLALSERMLARPFRRPRSGYTQVQEDILIGRGCSIDPSARIIGPAIIHDRAVIGRGVTVIGPAVLGASSRIGEEATIAQAVVAPQSVIEAGSTILHRVASGRCGSVAPGSDSNGPRHLPAFRPAASRQHTDGNIALPVQPGVDRRRLSLACKRAGDVALSAAGLIVLSPVMVLVAILVKLTSRGPVFFVHRRERRDGKDFPCLKFRTMVADAHERQREMYTQNEVDGPQFKIATDTRITTLGKWLRATNIDELPQLINVLAGHMSLVGPRPSPFRENQICVPWRRARLSVAPGITGLWQVCRADREGGDFHQWIYYDLAYVRYLSLWLDIKILVATVITLGGKWNVPRSWFITRARMRPATIPKPPFRSKRLYCRRRSSRIQGRGGTLPILHSSGRRRDVVREQDSSSEPPRHRGDPVGRGRRVVVLGMQ